MALYYISILSLAFVSFVQGVELVPDETTCREMIELLVSDRNEERQRGEALLQKNHATLIKEQIERLKDSPIPEKKEAAYNIVLLCSPWMRAKEGNSRTYGYIRVQSPSRPVERPDAIEEIPRIRSALMQAIEELLDQTQNNRLTGHESWLLETLCEALSEFADDETIDWSIKRLKDLDSQHTGQPFYDLVNSYLGLPRQNLSNGFCGNTSRENLIKLNETQRQDYLAATSELAELWNKLHDKSVEYRIKHAIAVWRNKYISHQERYSGHLHNSQLLFIELEPLIRMGIPALKSLRDQQYKETTLEAKGFWEVIISAINGHPSSGILDLLFKGKEHHLEIACEIIAASGRKDRLDQLKPLQYRKHFDGKIASKAILSAHRYEGLDALREGFAEDPDNFIARYAILELEERKEKGPPRGIRRH